MEVLYLTGGMLSNSWIQRRYGMIIDSLAVRSVDFRSFADDRSAADHMDLTESYNTMNSTGGSEDDSASTRLLS